MMARALADVHSHLLSMNKSAGGLEGLALGFQLQCRGSEHEKSEARYRYLGCNSAAIEAATVPGSQSISTGAAKRMKTLTGAEPDPTPRHRQA